MAKDVIGLINWWFPTQKQGDHKIIRDTEKTFPENNSDGKILNCQEYHICSLIKDLGFADP
jgi:hypothetical protein